MVVAKLRDRPGFTNTDLAVAVRAALAVIRESA